MHHKQNRPKRRFDLWRTRRIHSPRRIIKIRRVCVARVTARLRYHWACLLVVKRGAFKSRTAHHK